MLWLCIYLPQLALEAIACSKDDPVAVIVHEKNKRRIVGSNVDLRNITELTTALTIHASLRPLDRNPKAELAALKRLAAWAYQWSSFVTWREAQPRLSDYSSVLWLEIGASRALFGGYAALLQHIEHSLRALHYSYRIGVAPTLEGAALLARAGKRILVTSEKRLLTTIRTVSIEHLALSADILYALKTSGVTVIGQLLDIPAAAIARRFGPETTLYLDRVSGAAADPRPAYRLPKRYRERNEFGFGVESLTALLFPLQRMLHEFCGYLRALDIATQQYAVVFEHERSIATRIEMGLATPSRDARRLVALAREKLHGVELPGSVYALRIEAQEFAAPAIRQQGLFANDSEVTDELQETLEKITARLGDNVVRALETVADHRPENAWRFVEGSAHKTPPPTSARPLWLLPQPLQLQTPPQIDTHCESIEAGWWDKAIKRDYYVTRTATGEQCWVFYDPTDRQWYLQGFWA